MNVDDDDDDEMEWDEIVKKRDLCVEMQTLL